MKNFFRTDTAFFFIVTLTTLALGFIPMILQILHTPPDRIFPLVHNSPHDFYFYMALMNQGAHGNWLVSDPFTTEVTNQSFLGSFFVILGNIGGHLNLPHPVTYNVTRLASAFFLMAAIFVLYRLIFDKTRAKLAFFLYSIGGSWLRIVHTPKGWVTAVFMDWWTGIDATRRHVFLPHHLLAYTLLVISVSLFLRYWTRPKPVYLLCIFTMQTLAAFLLTSTTIVFLLTIPPVILASVWQERKKAKIALPRVVSVFLLWLSLLLPIILINQQVKLGFPWSQYKEWEGSHPYPVKNEILGALGILFPLALIALPTAVRSLTGIFLTSWAFVPIVLIFFGTSIPINPIRLTQGALFVPLAGLAAIGVHAISSRLSRIGRIGLIGLISLISLSTIIHSVTYHTLDLWNHASNTFLSHSDYRTFTKLAQVVSADSHVLGSFFTSNTAASFAYAKMFIGSQTYTMNLPAKEAQTIAFLKGEINEAQAREFLAKNKIDYVITVNHDNWLYGWPGNRYPNLLQPLYEEGTNGVYRVK